MKPGPQGGSRSLDVHRGSRLQGSLETGMKPGPQGGSRSLDVDTGSRLQGSLETGMEPVPQGGSGSLDVDSQLKRTGTSMTATAYIISAVMGSGVLPSSWIISQLGWIAGPTAIILFTFVTYYTSTRLAASYRKGNTVADPYMDAVKANLGGFQAKLCGATQYLNLFGVAIGYTISSSLSMKEIQRSNCFHSKGVNSPCKASTIPYKIVFGVMEIILLQIPSFKQIWWLSIVFAIMPITYSTIVLGLGVAKVAEAGEFKGSLNGMSVGSVTKSQKIFRIFQAIGSIAFAYSHSFLLEIQETLKSSQSDHKTMKKATLASLLVTTIFYMVCGCVGYAAFGDMSPENLLAGFGFYNPFWLVDIANAAIVIHHIGAYQVCCQPIFAFIEKTASDWFPDSRFINRDTPIRIPIPGLKKTYRLNLFNLVWRSIFVIITTIISMFVPYFNDALGILGALELWAFTFSLPVAIYIEENKIPEWSAKWICLQILSMSSLVISIAAAVGSVAGFVFDVKDKLASQH